MTYECDTCGLDVLVADAERHTRACLIWRGAILAGASSRVITQRWRYALGTVVTR